MLIFCKVLRGNDIKNTLFFLMLFFSAVPYILQSIFMVFIGEPVFWSYSKIMIEEMVQNTSFGLACKVVPYLKDILTVILFIMILLENKKRKILTILMFFIVIGYGTLISMIGNDFKIELVVAGIRSYIFFITAIIYCMNNSMIRNENLLDSIKKIICFTLFINLIIVSIQVITIDAWAYLGKGGYRFTGAFPHSGNLGGFSVAVTAYIYILYSGLKKISFIETFLIFVLSMYLSIAAGMRSAIILNFIFLLFLIIEKIYRMLRFPRENKTNFVLMTTGMLTAFLYGSMIEYIDRGDLLESGKTRVKILNEFLIDRGIYEWFFGNGVGYGTNAAVSLDIEGTNIVDGTVNTILNQYGIFGVIVFIILLFLFVFEFARHREKPLMLYGNFLVLILISISINIFEQVYVIILMTYNLFLIKNIMKMETIHE